ncbi:DUF397 domain-containing protein [Streptomyces griseocarneus]|nr:DUF397 domain-containing protein [Streptomyces griseocarneus]
MSATSDLSRTAWVKSSHSQADDGNCVEWAPTYASSAHAVPIRDSKQRPGGSILTVPPGAWGDFVGQT